MKNLQRIILAGGSGFLGTVLAGHLVRRGYEVVVLTRAPQPDSDGVRYVYWDGETPGDWAAMLEGAPAIINLAGRSVNCRYHPRNRKLILESRIRSTRVLGEAIARCENPPRVWLNASTATIYKHSLDRPMDEIDGEIGATPEAKDEFSVEVARAWEETFDKASTPATRKVALRTAMVLGNGANSVLPVLRRLVRFGLGGRLASGRQYVSWIHKDDFCRAIDWLIERENFSGPVNPTASHPVTNAEMMRTMRRVLGRSFGLPAAVWMLEVGAFLLRTETELIIKSRRVVPRRLIESGFQFRFSEFEDAVRDLQKRNGASA